VTLPEGITEISSSLFYDCMNLKTVIIPASVTTINGNAFGKCTDLTSIVIPDTVTTIYAFAFSYCYNITINCEATEKPDGWENMWDYAGFNNGVKYCTVVWGYTGEE
jgi:hypothetical protein